MMRLIGVLFLALLAGNVQAGKARVAFDEFMSGLKTLEARFEQSVLDTESSRQGMFHGVFMLKRPGRFRWDYLSPEPKQIIADGLDLWIAEDDLEQITQYRQSWALQDTPATILLSDSPLEESFEVAEVGEHRGLEWLELIPHNTEGNVERVLLAFKGMELRQLELTDKLGQISRFSFFEIKRNPELADEHFVFTPPPDWDVFQF